MADKKEVKRALVHVVSSNVHIVCPWCQAGTMAAVKRHMQPKNVRCLKCKGIFILEFNFRGHYRKRLDILGEVFVSRNQMYNVRMIDVSVTGVGFQGVGIHSILPEGKVVKIRFQLPNAKKTQVEAEVEIKFSARDKCGAKFKNIGAETLKSIGFWLMP